MLGALLLGLHYVRKVVNQYTDTQPVKLPSVQMSQPEIENLSSGLTRSKRRSASDARPSPWL